MLSLVVLWGCFNETLLITFWQLPLVAVKLTLKLKKIYIQCYQYFKPGLCEVSVAVLHYGGEGGLCNFIVPAGAIVPCLASDTDSVCLALIDFPFCRNI